jgi:hypothetical protein
MKNPNPIARARRIEMRRKQLGYPSRCFYCPESEVFCFEQDHVVTEELDPHFNRVECRNCHRKLEARRDIKGLTNNGKRPATETESEALKRYLCLLAEDQETIAEHVLTTPPELIAKALLETAASLRRKAQGLSLVRPCASSRQTESSSCRVAVTSKTDARRRRRKKPSA